VCYEPLVLVRLGSFRWAFLKGQHVRTGWLVSGLVFGAAGVAGVITGCGTEISEFPRDVEDPPPPEPEDSGPGFSSGNTVGDAGKGNGDGGPACATARAETTRTPVYLNLVLDGSGSMDGMKPTRNPDCAPLALPDGCEECTPSRTACWQTDSRDVDPLVQDGARRTGKRWLAARAALKAYFDQKASEDRNDLAIGMFVFATTPAQSAVPVGRIDQAQAGSLWGTIQPGVWPDGLTPMRSAVENQLAALASFSPSSPLLPDGKRVLVLITDGVPYGGVSNTYENRDGVTAAVVGARSGASDISTAVIGVGNPLDGVETYDETFLSALAQSGGLAAAGCDPNWDASMGGTPCHLQITPGEKTVDVLQAEIAQAIEAIGIQVASCELSLDQSSPIDPENVNVIYTESAGATASQIDQGMPDGWTYDDDEAPTKVILHGASCDRLKTNPQGKVDIVIGCPTGTDVIIN